MMFTLDATSTLDWRNEALAVYHGTVEAYVASLLDRVNLDFARGRSDFGRGFYTTTREPQARDWALRSSALRRSLGAGAAPAVVRFDIARDRLAALDSLWFVRGGFDAEDYWSLIRRCRTGLRDHARSTDAGWYDVVAGPVAINWKRRIILPEGDQVSFHTARAVALLSASNPRKVPW